MLEQLQAMITGVDAPSFPTVGEAYLLYNSLAAYYYLRSKSQLYQHHLKDGDLKAWWAAAEAALTDRIGKLEAIAERLGVPKPETVPSSTELTDQFMALDGMAMIQGMMQADSMGVQSSRRPELASLYMAMYANTVTYGGKLLGIIQREGWEMVAPTYPVSPQH